MGELVASHLVEDDECKNIYPCTGIRTDGGSTHKQVALFVEDKCYLGFCLIVRIKE